MYRLYMYIVWISIYNYITYLQVYNIYIYNYVHAQVYIAGSEHHGREYDPLQSLIEVKPKIWKLPTSHPSKWKTEHPKFFKVLTQTSLRCMFTFWNWTIAILCHLASIIPCLRRSRFGIRQAHPEDISSKPLKLKPLSWWIKIVLYKTKLRPKTHLHRGDVSLKNVKETIRGSGTSWFLIVVGWSLALPSIFSELSPSEIMVEHMLKPALLWLSWSF